MPPAAIDFVALIVALEPLDVAIAFKGKYVRRYAIQEPTIMTDNDSTAGKTQESLLEGAQSIDVEIVRWLIEQQKIPPSFRSLAK